MHGWYDKDIEFYDQPTLGYQVIFLVPRRGDYWTLYTMIEYQYGFRYSYPVRDEGEG